MKSQRQNAILRIISNNDIETQEDLMDLLKEAGYDVTQATISRDIRELKLTKIANDHGGQKYSVMHQNNNKDILLKTVAGMAMAVAAAVDSMHFEGVVGCIAGDDTIFCAVRTVEETFKVADKIRKLTSDSKM